MNEWTNEQKTERVSEWMNEQTNKRPNEWVNEWTNEQKTERVSEWMNEQTNKRTCSGNQKKYVQLLYDFRYCFLWLTDVLW
jgi:hypothetical protein